MTEAAAQASARVPVQTQAQSRLPFSSILVRREARQRRQIETEDLEASIRKNGLIQPIVVMGLAEPGPQGQSHELVAGERRLTSCMKLHVEGHWPTPDLPVVFLSDLPPLQRQIIELEENIKRADLPWRDIVASVAGIHALYLELEGPEWTMGETADAVSLSLSTVSMYLRVHAELRNERVADAGTVREAYNVIARQDQRAAGDALQELLEVPGPTPAALPVTPFDEAGTVSQEVWDALPKVKAESPLVQVKPQAKPPEAVICKSFLEWAPAYTGPKFNFVHCDFPYGVELFSGPQGRGAEPIEGQYTDSEATFQALLECFCTYLDRFMSVSAHLMFWFSARPGSQRETFIRQTFAQRAPSLVFRTFPLIWHKTDNAGIAADVRRDPRHVYETALFASRGARQIVKIKGDLYPAPTDKRLHASTKPEPMLRHFFEMIVDEHTTVLDPTCGSGAALRAAESLGAKRVLGLEIDKGIAELARTALNNARSLAKASRVAAAGK